jgi:phosphoribosylglycinamide formyltransferase-1
MSSRKRVGILISGRGSNMASLIEACKAPDYPAEIAVVISNRPDAPGLAKASEAGITTQTIDHKLHDSRQAFEQVLDEALRDAGVELVCNAGFMRLLTEFFVERWRDRQLNIHPSLLPAFKGLDTHERVLEAGAMITGCTVHFVRLETDSGPIIAQAAVPVESDDTPETLAARVLGAEHQLYPLALRLIASGAAQVKGERVVWQNGGAGGVSLFWPPIG